MTKEIILEDKTFELYLPGQRILSRVKELASAINSDYSGREVLFLAVLNGSFMFAADLFRYLTISCSISFVKYSSYRGGTVSGSIRQVIGLNTDAGGKEVVLLEDIIDSGQTMRMLQQEILDMRPAGLEIATLLYKSHSLFPKTGIRYIGFEIPQDFVVGYGLDYREHGRNLGDIYREKYDVEI